MTRNEFAGEIAYITGGIGKPLAPESLLVYFDLLGDLPLDVLRVAARRVCLEHKWPSFPTVAEIREIAAETMRGELDATAASEAWEIAWRAVRNIDLEVIGQADRVMAGMPPLVLEAMRKYGLDSLVRGKEPVTIVRAQFMKIFAELVARENHRALLPASVHREIERIGERSLPAPVAQVIGKIGQEVA